MTHTASLSNNTTEPNISLSTFPTDAEILRVMVENTSDSIVVTDAEGITLYANKAAQKITGYSLEEVVGKKAGGRELWGGQMSKEYYTSLWKTIKEDKKPFFGEIKNKRKDSELYPAQIQINPVLDAAGEVTMFVCTEKDISEEKNAEEQVVKVLNDLQERSQTLAQEKARIESLLANVGDGIIATDQDGCIITSNDSAQEMLGFTHEDVVGKPAIEVLTLTDEKNQPMPIGQRPMILALSTGKKSVLPRNPTYYLTRKDGSRFAVGITVTPYVLNNKIIGTIVVIRDITIEKNIDKAKTEFVSLASHQLRTPLAAINWYTEMLVKGDVGTMTPEQKEFLDIIYTSNHRMIALVNSLLNVSRIELGTLAIDPEEIEIVAVAESVLAELAPKIAEKKIEVHTSYNPDKIMMNADPKLINILFQNLLSNAVKYNKNGGKVTLNVEQTADGFHIIVEDTGLGIPRNDQSRIFEKLFRAENVRASETEGTGLGLYLVKSIVENCKGTLQFQSEEQKGTRFAIHLPPEGMPRVTKSQLPQ